MNPLAESIETSVSEDGTISEGFLFASVKNTGDAVAIVNGVELHPGKAKAFPFVGKGYKAVDYTAEGTTLDIMYIL